ANSASKTERKAAGARGALGDATATVEAEAALQKAHAKLEQAEQRKQEELQQVSEGDLEAMRGLLLQLRRLPTARPAGNFARAWELTMEQLQAVDEMFAPQEPAAPKRPRARWGGCCPVDGGAVASDSDADLELDSQPAAERGQAGRRPAAAGPRPRVAPSAVQELAAAAADAGPLATLASSGAE
ncbi:unnamed protein product, partial [Prorocentrum cordatum]